MAEAIISDVHANIEALIVVLHKIKELGADKIDCLGDIVGYGPNPNECCELIRENCNLKLMGNHDAFVANAYPETGFVGLRSGPVINETTKDLTKKNIRFLKGLVPKHRALNKTYAHGNPAHIVPFCIREYILADLELREPKRKIDGTNPVQARFFHHMQLEEIFDYMLGKNRNHAFVGHTHLAFAARRPKIKENTDKIEVIIVRHNLDDNNTSFELELDPDYQYILNPGAVGQPRDWDNRASFMVYEENKATWYRCDYDLEKTIRKLSEFRIDDKYIKRLEVGE